MGAQMAREEERTADRDGRREDSGDREQEGGGGESRGVRVGRRGEEIEKGREVAGDGRADTDTEAREEAEGIRPDKKWGVGRRRIKGSMRKGKRAQRGRQKHGGLVSASSRGGPSPSPASHSCPSSTHPGKRWRKALSSGGRG